MNAIVITMLPWLVLVLLAQACLVSGQSCELAGGLAVGFAKTNQCGCTAPTACEPCVGSPDGKQGLVQCSNGCTYCDSTKSVCGVFGSGVARSEVSINTGGVVPLTVVLWSISFSWAYTKGRAGTLVYISGLSEPNCTVLVNATACRSCVMQTCPDTTLQPNIDCTNLEAGATATACSGRLGDGYVSLDASALTGILAPLAAPFYLCQVGAVVLEAGVTTPIVPVVSPVTTPRTSPATLPAGAPVTTPVLSPAATPRTTPVTLPASPPATVPVSVPVTTPRTVPVASPIGQPVGTPLATKAPAATPRAAPALPLSAPVTIPFTPVAAPPPVTTPTVLVLPPLASTPVNSAPTGTMPAPMNPPMIGSVPVPSPVTVTPPAAPVPSCGFLNLGLFCLRGCGLLRRILGLCT